MSTEKLLIKFLTDFTLYPSARFCLALELIAVQQLPFGRNVREYGIRLKKDHLR